MLIFDAHLDLAFNALDWQRDLETDVHSIRQSEAHLTELGRKTGTVSLPEMRKGDIGLAVATLFARKRNDGSGFGCATYEACYGSGCGQLGYYHALEQRGVAKILKSGPELSAHAACWQNDSANTPLGFLISIECADMVRSPEDIFLWHARGVRFIGLTHYNVNRYGGGTRAAEGLHPSAKQLLSNMESLGMPLDMTHLSDRSFNDAIEWFHGPVLASHNNARKFCDWQRQFTDDQIRAIVKREGVIGVALDAIMLQPNWVRGVTLPEVTMDRLIDNMDHICQLAGNPHQVAIGSDLDGGYGYEQTPKDLNSISDLQKLPEMLSRRGYSDEVIAGFMHRNWLRYFEKTLPE